MTSIFLPTEHAMASDIFFGPPVAAADDVEMYTRLTTGLHRPFEIFHPPGSFGQKKKVLPLAASGRIIVVLVQVDTVIDKALAAVVVGVALGDEYTVRGERFTELAIATDGVDLRDVCR